MVSTILDSLTLLRETEAIAAICDVNDYARFLNDLDPYCLLTKRTSEGRLLKSLASLFEQIRQIGIPTESLTLFEVGSHHRNYRPSDGGGPLHGGIAHFFSLHRDEFPFRYFAFDPRSGPEPKWPMPEYALEGCKYPEEIIEPIVKGLKKSDIPSFELLKERVNDCLEALLTPIIFSNQVLNYEYIENDNPFWLLPGIHIHRAWFGEICQNRDIGYSEQFEQRMNQLRAVGKEPKWNPHDGSVYIDQLRNELNKENLRLDPEAHKFKFRQYFSIKPEIDISVNYDPRTDEIVYVWRNQAHQHH